MKRISTDSNWITTGELPSHDFHLLLSCICMFGHAVPVAFAFEGEFLTTLADLVKARKGTGRAMPSNRVSGVIAASPRPTLRVKLCLITSGQPKRP